MAVDYTRRSFPGAPSTTTLSAGIGASDATITITDATGWPDGSAGPWWAAIDAGLAAEEKVKLASRSGTTLTVASSGRGADGTAAAAHANAAQIYCCWSATDADTANAHYNDAADNHTQYLNGARHDITARHTFGAAFATPSAPPAIGTSANAGTASGPPRSDHTHNIGTGAINAAAMIADGTITGAKLANDTVTGTQIATGAVGSTEMAANAVASANIIDGSIVDADVNASAAIANSKLATSGVTAGTYGNAFQYSFLTVNDRGIITSAANNTLPIWVSYQKSGTVATFTQTTLSAFTVVPGTKTITNPGKAVLIHAEASGFVFVVTENTTTHTIRLGLSTDGGTSFNYGNSVQVKCGINPVSNGQFSVLVANDSVTPTGDILCRLEWQSAGAAASNYQLQGGYITVTAHPA